MDTLVFKAVASPLLIQAASLAGRRWGPAVGGWFVGLPLTSGPVALFLAIDQGKGFAAAAAIGSVAGTAAQAGFGAAYALVAQHRPWPIAFAAGIAAFAGVGFLLETIEFPLWALLLIAECALIAALSLIPHRAIEAEPAPVRPR